MYILSKKKLTGVRQIVTETASCSSICDALRNLVPLVKFKKRENFPSWVFFMFFTIFKLYKWYQIAQNITYVKRVQNTALGEPENHYDRNILSGKLWLALKLCICTCAVHALYFQEVLPEVWTLKSEAYSKPSGTSKMEHAAKMVNGWNSWTIFAKSFIRYSIRLWRKAAPLKATFYAIIWKVYRVTEAS